MSPTDLTHFTHNEYPHLPGTLYDCQACESACHCTPDSAECVYGGPHNGAAAPETGPSAPLRPENPAPVPNTTPAFNDPTVPCCGRDAADCDCPDPAALALVQRVGVTLVNPDHTRRRRFPAVAQCVFAGSSHRTADELACDIVRLAIAWGATDEVLPNIDETMAEVLAYKAEWWDGGVGPGVLWLTDTDLGLDLQNGLYDLLGQALDYLNDPANGVAPDGYEFELDDGLYLCPAEDEDAR